MNALDRSLNHPHGFVAMFGRLLIAVLFLDAAFGMLAAPQATLAEMHSAGLPLVQLGYVIALVTDIGGALLLIVGYRTRLVGFALALFTLITALIFHHDFADPDQLINFVKNVAIAGGLLQLTAFGAGALSLDARRRTRGALFGRSFSP
jgi:putative oxidoreductase